MSAFLLSRIGSEEKKRDKKLEFRTHISTEYIPLSYTHAHIALYIPPEERERERESEDTRTHTHTPETDRPNAIKVRHAGRP